MNLSIYLYNLLNTLLLVSTAEIVPTFSYYITFCDTQQHQIQWITMFINNVYYQQANSLEN